MQDRSALQTLSTLRSLTDRQLVNNLTAIAMFERAAIAKLVAILSEFDERRLYLPLGFTSLFAYCTNRLGLSQDEAFYRIEAARVVRRFPVVLDYLDKGALTLTTTRLLGPHLTSDNHVKVLETASHQKKPEVEVLIARLRPKPDVPSTIRKLPALSQPPRVDPPAVQLDVPAVQSNRMSASDSCAVTTSPAGLDQEARETPSDLFARPVDTPTRRPILAPLSESSYRLQITISRSTHDTLRTIQALIRHAIPSGDPAAIVERSLDLLLADLRRKKAAQVRHPRNHPPVKTRGRQIPASVRRKVWDRDGGRCAFRSEEGDRCDADGFLEYHHVTPYAKGGAATADNIQLRCRAHNQHEAAIAGLGRRPDGPTRRPKH